MYRIKELENAYDEFNNKRISYALEIMSYEGERLFHLVPLLLHFNNQALPCCLPGDIPHGIHNFKPNIHQKKILEQIEYESNQKMNIEVECSILSLFCMGSTSSVGQGPRSDVDYWVCVSKYMDTQKIALLEKKCLYIKNLAREQYGQDINFFVVKENKFLEKNLAIADAEDCGTAQHMFLLDEFYRSTIYVAGQKILWMIVPCKREHDYEHYVKSLVNENKIKKTDWIDFGQVGDIPSDEYYGSALWLLYKGTDAPYKAVIKILLMEAYSNEYPNTFLVSMQIKDNMHKKLDHVENLDSYYMVYKKINDYLEKRNDNERIDLLRVCFYLKISDDIQSIEKPTAIIKRKNFVKKLLTQWNWSKSRVEKLNKRNQINIFDIKKMYGTVFNALMQSYKSLLLFGERNNIIDAINFTDMCVLSRKLYSSFDTHEDKINIFLLDKAYSVYEKDISIVEVSKSSLCRSGWYIFTSSLNSREIIVQKPLVRFDELSRAVIFSYFNKILDENTKIHVKSENEMDSNKVKSFISDLDKTFKDSYVVLTNKNLLLPAQITKCGVYVNVTSDPTNDIDLLTVNNNDLNVFSFGEKGLSLVGSIDIVMSNTWNEIIHRHYEGTYFMHEFISDLLDYLVIGEGLSVDIDCYVYSKHTRNYIHKQVVLLIQNCLNLIHSETDKFVDFLYNGAYSKIYYSGRKFVFYSDDLSRPEKDNSIPSIISNNSMYGCVQYFIIKHSNGWYDIYQSDEHSIMKVYYGFKGNITDFIHEISLFYSKNTDTEGTQKKCVQYFNLPQFLYVNIEDNVLEPFCI